MLESQIFRWICYGIINFRWICLGICYICIETTNLFLCERNTPVSKGSGWKPYCWTDYWLFALFMLIGAHQAKASSWLLIILVLASSQLIGYQLSGDFVPGYWKYRLPARTFAHRYRNRHRYRFLKSCLCFSCFILSETIWNLKLETQHHLKPASAFEILNYNPNQNALEYLALGSSFL